MNPNLKRYLTSSLITFVTAFVISLGAQLSAGVPANMTWTFLGSLLSVAIRAAVKAIGEYIVNTTGDVVPATPVGRSQQ